MTHCEPPQPSGGTLSFARRELNTLHRNDVFAPNVLSAPPCECLVTSGWNDVEPSITILCPTYMHEAYISYAIDGFLSQITKFPFKILIRDDHSTDKTQAILKNYQERFPTLIEVITRPENSWLEVKPLTELLPLAQTPFISVSEGDDYWTSPFKLAKQVESLLKNPEAAVSFHDTVGITNKEVFSNGMLPQNLKRSLPPGFLLKAPGISLPSMVFRNYPDLASKYDDMVHAGDRFLISKLGERGSAIYEEELSGAVVFRRHSGGVNSMIPSREKAKFASKSFNLVSSYHLERGNVSAASHFENESVLHAISALRFRDRMRLLFDVLKSDYLKQRAQTKHILCKVYRLVRIGTSIRRRRDHRYGVSDE